MDIHRKRPKRLRPIIRNPVGEQFWDYCQKNGLIMDSVATIAVSEWLDRQEQQRCKAS